MYNPQFAFGDFQSNIQALKHTTTNVDVTKPVNFSAFNSDHFFNQIKFIDRMDENSIILLIKNHIDVIVERTLSDDTSMGSILSHPKFVNAYYKAMKMIPIDYDRRLFCNKLTYEYSIIDNYDKEILKKFREISSYVNADIVRKLTNKGVPIRAANDLVTCRYSSRRENVNIQRLNFNMCKYSSETFNEQMIIWVYEILFDRIGELFITSMLEVYSEEEMDDLALDFRDIYGNVSLAILTILNNMPSTSIREIILKYIDRYVAWYRVKHELPRFTLRSLSYDYERISRVVDKLLAEGIDVP